MEAIFGLAVDFCGSQMSGSVPANGPLSLAQFQLQVDEFLERIIEAVNSLPWLLVRMPPQCGEHLWTLYRERAEQLLTAVERCESIFWAIRRGFGQLPRRRDFSSLHLFRSLPLSALEDAQKRWDVHLEHLRDACEEMKALVRPRPGHSISFGGLGEEGSGEDHVRRRFSTASAASNDSIPDESIDLPYRHNAMAGFETASLSGTEDLDLVKKIVPACKLIHTVFKKIKLRCLGGFNGANSDSTAIHSPFGSSVLGGDGNPGAGRRAGSGIGVSGGSSAEAIGDSRQASSPQTVSLVAHPCAKPASPRRALMDDLLDAADPIPLLVVDIPALLAHPPSNVPVLCGRLIVLVRAAQNLIDLVKTWMDGEHLRWFEVAARQLDSFLLPLIEINPPR
jgi:hypothetical protein